jgi:hypothetical protein
LTACSDDAVLLALGGYVSRRWLIGLAIADLALAAVVVSCFAIPVRIPVYAADRDSGGGNVIGHLPCSQRSMPITMDCQHRVADRWSIELIALAVIVGLGFATLTLARGRRARRALVVIAVWLLVGIVTAGALWVISYTYANHQGA